MTTKLIDPCKLSAAETVLWNCGITLPHEIDVHRIALSFRAEIITREMHGCDARLVKDGSGAIISINQNTNPRRQRFSIAHEIGHLALDFKNGGFRCTKADIVDSESGQRTSAEARANAFASQLLLPSYIFNPFFDNLPQTLQSIQTVADVFNASITATAIKSIHRFSGPACVALYGKDRRRWFFNNGHVPDDWFPVSQIHYDQPELDFLYKGGSKTLKSTSEARHWFSGKDVWRHRVNVESFLPQQEAILVLISLIP